MKYEGVIVETNAVRKGDATYCYKLNQSSIYKISNFYQYSYGYCLLLFIISKE